MQRWVKPRHRLGAAHGVTFFHASAGDRASGTRVPDPRTRGFGDHASTTVCGAAGSPGFGALRTRRSDSKAPSPTAAGQGRQGFGDREIQERGGSAVPRPDGRSSTRAWVVGESSAGVADDLGRHPPRSEESSRKTWRVSRLGTTIRPDPRPARLSLEAGGGGVPPRDECVEVDAEVGSAPQGGALGVEAGPAGLPRRKRGARDPLPPKSTESNQRAVNHRSRDWSTRPLDASMGDQGALVFFFSFVRLFSVPKIRHHPGRGSGLL